MEELHMNKTQTNGIITAVNQLRVHSIRDLKNNLNQLALEVATQSNYDPDDSVHNGGITAIMFVCEFLTQLQEVYPFNDALANSNINIGVIGDIVMSQAELLNEDPNQGSAKQKQQTLYDLDQCNNFISHLNSKFN